MEKEYGKKKVVLERFKHSYTPDRELFFSDIESSLKRHKIHSDKLVFSGFPAEGVAGTVSKGSYRLDQKGKPKKFIFCSTLQDIREGLGDHDRRTALDYAWDYPYPAMAVYDETKLISTDPAFDKYKPKTTFKDALLAVFEIVD